MKKLLIASIFLCFGIIANSQNIQTDQNCCNPPGGANTCTDYFYSEEGVLESSRISEGGTNVSRVLFAFEEDNLIEERFQIWNGSNWINDILVTNDFVDGNLDFITTRTWNGSVWVNSTQIRNIFEDGELTQVINREWDDSAWINIDRVLNESGQRRYQDFVDGVWMNTQLLVDVISDGLLTQQVMREWNGSAWVNSSRIVFEDFEDDVALTQRDQIWNGSAWTNSSLLSSNLNTDGTVDEIVTRSWNGSVWINETLTKNVYENDNLTQVIDREWDGSAWINTTREVLNYDENNINWQSLFQTWNGSNWITDLNCRDEYTILETVSVVEIESNILDLHISPNPTTEYIEVFTSNGLDNSISIVNVTGANVFETQLNGTVTTLKIDVSNLEKGVYFIKIINKNFERATKKFFVF